MTDKQEPEKIHIGIEKGNYNETVKGNYIEGDVNIHHHYPTENPILQPVWNRLDPQLQDAFVLAANQAHREGKNIVSTRLLFAALRRLTPQGISAIFEKIPTESLPKPIDQEVKIDQNAIDQNLNFSDCVRESLATLSPKITNERKLSSVDIFVHIAKHGNGISVQRLRTYGVDAEKIARIVKQLGYQIIERDQ
ncbi:MAG: hypothetical protein ACRC8K_15470 [Waterburya sp.]